MGAAVIDGSPSGHSEPLLVVDGVSKHFGITHALTDVSVSFYAGEVHALMGENGAGKSTLGKAIAGLHKPDTGTITLDGRKLAPGSVDDAFAAGVRIVHQELAQCPNLSVAENLSLHDLPRNRLGMVDRGRMRERASVLLRELEPLIDVDAALGSLPPGHRQIVQIAGSLDEQHDSGHGAGARVIVFDEPTSSLSIAETERLMSIIAQLRARGLTILYVSHRMSEIFACCDRVTVLRDGKYIATSNVKDIDEPTLVEQMIGRRVQTPEEAVRAAASEKPHLPAAQAREDDIGDHPVVLSARDISSRGKLHGVSLDVRGGEILGIGGLVGAGRSELLDAIFGLDAHATGTVEVSGERMPMRKPRAAIAAKIGYVPEDRRLQGLFFNLWIAENIVVPFMPDLAHAGVRDVGGERSLVGERLRTFQVKAASPAALPGSLSGGNQQKLLIARWMAEDTKVLLMDEPTRGIDVGTKAEVYRLVRAAASKGAAVVFVSSEMPELLAISHRLIVLAEGRIAGELHGEEMTQTNVLSLATREHVGEARGAV